MILSRTNLSVVCYVFCNNVIVKKYLYEQSSFITIIMWLVMCVYCVSIFLRTSKCNFQRTHFMQTWRHNGVIFLFFLPISLGYFLLTSFANCKNGKNIDSGSNIQCQCFVNSNQEKLQNIT